MQQNVVLLQGCTHLKIKKNGDRILIWRQLSKRGQNMSGAAYRPADQKLVFHVTEKVSPQQTSVTNTYIPHQSSICSNHSNSSVRSTGSGRLLSTGSSKQDSVQDVETNPTVRFYPVEISFWRRHRKTSRSRWK